MQQNGLSEQQLNLLDNIKSRCKNLKTFPWEGEAKNVLHLDTRNARYLNESLDRIILSVNQIKYSSSIDPVFKEFLDDPENETVGVFDLKVGKLFKKLIEKVITLEQTIEELKSK